ncbi:PfkB family carbohydrate kinase [Pseudoalteromonas espejiana]
MFNISNSAAALINEDSVSSALASNCRYFHVMGSSLGNAGSIAAVKRALELVKQSGAKVSFDPNIRPEIMASPVIQEAIQLILEACDILLPSEIDLQYFCGDVAQSEAVNTLLSKYSMEMVVVKNADEGCVYYDRARSIHMPSFKVTEVDPTGAGDCFGGTLIACLAQGVEIESRIKTC